MLGDGNVCVWCVLCVCITHCVMVNEPPILRMSKANTHVCTRKYSKMPAWRCARDGLAELILGYEKEKQQQRHTHSIISTERQLYRVSIHNYMICLKWDLEHDYLSIGIVAQFELVELPMNALFWFRFKKKNRTVSANASILFRDTQKQIEREWEIGRDRESERRRDKAIKRAREQESER